MGTHRATLGGVKGPSGCVATKLSWHDDRRQYSLEVAGPVSLEEQRATLMQAAKSIAQAADLGK